MAAVMLQCGLCSRRVTHVGAVSRRSRDEVRRGEEASEAASSPAVLYFDGRGTRGQMSVTRQGVSRYSGKAALFKFTEADFHQEFVVETGARNSIVGCISPVFVMKGSGRLCNVGLYTRKKRSCAALGSSNAAKELAKLDRIGKFAPSAGRAFGLEFEFTARKGRAKIKQCLKDAGGAGAWPNFDRWPFTYTTGHAITAAEAKEIGASPDETQGDVFEVTSPAPPHALAGRDGFRRFVRALAVMRHVGIQASPDHGFHVHVNVLDKVAGGVVFTQQQIIYVWAAYVKYQFVIDEMLSPSRIINKFAYRLILGNCKAMTKPDRGSPFRGGLEDPCGMVRREFEQMHAWVQKKRTASNIEFCDEILKTPGVNDPCTKFLNPNKRFLPPQRWFHLNLTPLAKYGTVEFRTHSATHDPERTARWVQFCVAFVEHFGRAPGNLTGMAAYFVGSAEGDHGKLQRAQRLATRAELFAQLRGMVDKGSEEYYRFRRWEKGDKSCRPKAKPKTLRPACGKKVKLRVEHRRRRFVGGHRPQRRKHGRLTSLIAEIR